MKSQLDEFLKGAGQRPYRQLVEHHLSPDFRFGHGTLPSGPVAAP